jgi:hypothetical protein
MQANPLDAVMTHPRPSLLKAIFNGRSTNSDVGWGWECCSLSPSDTRSRWQRRTLDYRERARPVSMSFVPG